MIGVEPQKPQDWLLPLKELRADCQSVAQLLLGMQPLDEPMRGPVRCPHRAQHVALALQNPAVKRQLQD